MITDSKHHFTEVVEKLILPFFGFSSPFNRVLSRFEALLPSQGIGKKVETRIPCSHILSTQLAYEVHDVLFSWSVGLRCFYGRAVYGSLCTD